MQSPTDSTGTTEPDATEPGTTEPNHGGGSVPDNSSDETEPDAYIDADKLFGKK